MKKILAMILVMCMAAAAVPALAEDGLTGTWYMLVMGLTTATFELNDDGSCTLEMENEGEEMKAEGTWTAEGEAVTLKVGEQQEILLVYDGETLKMNPESAGEITGDMGNMADMGEMIGAMIQISREPGKISLKELNAFQEDGTLPEGKTKADMEAIQNEMMIAALSLLATVNPSGAGTQATGDAAVLTVVEENFYVRESYFGKEGVYIAKVQNNTESPLVLNNGLLVVKDADGKEIGRKEYLGTCGSRYLEPGEISYASMMVDVGEGLTVDAYEAKIEASANGYARKDTELKVDSAELRPKEGYSGTDYYTAVTVTNPGSEPLAGIGVIAIIRDSEGKMIDVSDSSIGINELGAGSSFIFVNNVDSAAVKYCDANQLKPAEPEAYAWAEEMGF